MNIPQPGSSLEKGPIFFKRLLSGISESNNSRHNSQASGLNLSSQELFGVKNEQTQFGTHDNRLLDRSEDFLEKTFFPCPSDEYDPNLIPPDFKKCKKHEKTHKVAPVNFDSANWEVSESTGMPITNKQISLWCSLSELGHLGPVIPMYFTFIKQLILIIGGLILVPIAVSAIQRRLIISEYPNFIEELLIDDTQSMITILVPLALCLVLFVTLYGFRLVQKRIKQDCKKHVLTPSDYTIMCYNMGEGLKEEEVKMFFSAYIVPEYTLDVAKVVVTYNIFDYVKKIRELKTLFKKRDDLKKTPNYIDQKKVDGVNAQIKSIDHSLSFIRQNRPKHQGLRQNGLCFVSFGTKQEAKVVRRRYEFSVIEKFSKWFVGKCTDGYLEHFYKENFITVKKAPELYEIVWENLDCNKSCRGPSILIILVSLGISVISCFGIKYLKRSNISGIPYLFGIIIAIGNELSQAVIIWLAPYCKFKTITQLQINIGHKICLFQFINMTAPIFIVDVFMLPFKISTLSFDILIIGLIAFVLPLALKLLDFSYILKLFKRKSILKKDKNCKLTQEQANSIFEDPDFQLWLLYPHVIKIFTFTCIYATFSPALSIIAVFALIAFYWIDKYNLLRRSLTPSNFRSELAEAMFEFVDLGVFFIAVGTCIFSNIAFTDSQVSDPSSVPRKLNAPNIFILVFSAMYMLIPHSKLTRKCFSRLKSLDRSAGIFYQQAAAYFINDYQSINPVCLDLRVQKDLKKNHYKSLNGISELKTLRDAPELLPIFDYAIRRPRISDIWSGECQGLRNPYYFFPQNYSYKIVWRRPHNRLLDNEREKEKERASAMTRREDELDKNKPRASEATLRVAGRLSSDASQRANSIMNDIKLIPSFTEKPGDKNWKTDDSLQIGFSDSFHEGLLPSSEKSDSDLKAISLRPSQSPLNTLAFSPIPTSMTGNIVENL